MMLGVFVVVWLTVFNTVTIGHTAPTTSTPPAAGSTLLQSMKQMLATLQQGVKQIPTSIKPQSSSGVGTSGSSTELLAIKMFFEAKLETMQTKLEATQAIQKEMRTKLDRTEAKQATTQATLKTLKSNRKSGSTFIRWGRKTCNNASHLVYSGVAGGSYYDHLGAAANPLCLTLTPQFDNTRAHPTHHALLYGAEYQDFHNRHDHDVPCSVCRVPQSTTIMIPATHACPKGWTTQYAGHLSAGNYNYKAASQYVCVDRDPENSSSGHRNDNGYLFYYTLTRCGSLPCPPYVHNKVVLCVVCSK